MANKQVFFFIIYLYILQIYGVSHYLVETAFAFP